MKYANIIIDIVHEKLDRTFQYRIPENLQQKITVGMLVLIPFGKGNRAITGYVIEVSDQPEVEENRLKDILQVQEDRLPVESQMIQVAAWMRQTYGSTMIQALKVVLPVKKKVREVENRSVVLCTTEKEARERLAAYQKKNAKAKIRLLEALVEQSQLSMEIVNRKLSIPPATLQAMLQEGVIEQKSERQMRNPMEVQMIRKEIQLSCEQQQAVDRIMDNDRQHNYQTYLLHGITGSGKTEVYIALIEQIMKQKRQAIVLIPEIALTFQTVQRFMACFGDQVSILNSRMSAGERYDQMQRAKKGEVSVIIGPRSALFTPFPNLGIIIIDEEHEASYKSENVPKYHARETAVFRAKLAHASVVLGSATPSIDAYYRAMQGEYTLLTLHSRANGSQRATVYIEDLREELREGNRSIFSRRLRALMEEKLARKQQILLFLNRRGYVGFVSCRSCGSTIKCPHCDVALSLHYNRKLICHYCGYEQPQVKACPVCGSTMIGGFKAGTEQVEQLVHHEFPSARVLRMDADTTRGKNGHQQIVRAFFNQEADILVGTQMIVKGHDFPHVTLMGILAADLSLNSGGYAGSERTFQLLTQAAGRAGRSKEAGEVVIQTYEPQHYSIVCAAQQDYESFYHKELKFRELMQYPPVGKMMEIFLSGEQEEAVRTNAHHLAAQIQFWLDKMDLQVQLIGPASPAVARLQDQYRQVMYLKSAQGGTLQLMRGWIEQYVAKQELQQKKILIQYDYQ